MFLCFPYSLQPFEGTINDTDGNLNFLNQNSRLRTLYLGTFHYWSSQPQVLIKYRKHVETVVCGPFNPRDYYHDWYGAAIPVMLTWSCDCLPRLKHVVIYLTTFDTHTCSGSISKFVKQLLFRPIVDSSFNAWDASTPGVDENTRGKFQNLRSVYLYVPKNHILIQKNSEAKAAESANCEVIQNDDFVSEENDDDESSGDTTMDQQHGAKKKNENGDEDDDNEPDISERDDDTDDEQTPEDETHNEEISNSEGSEVEDSEDDRVKEREHGQDENDNEQGDDDEGELEEEFKNGISYEQFYNLVGAQLLLIVVFLSEFRAWCLSMHH